MRETEFQKMAGREWRAMLAEKLRCANAIPGDRGAECCSKCQYYHKETEEERKEIESMLLPGDLIPDGFCDRCDFDRLVEDCAKALEEN